VLLGLLGYASLLTLLSVVVNGIVLGSTAFLGVYLVGAVGLGGLYMIQMQLGGLSFTSIGLLAMVGGASREQIAVLQGGLLTGISALILVLMPVFTVLQPAYRGTEMKPAVGARGQFK
jgi:hypothetical protein